MINTKDKIDKPIKRPNENEYMVYLKQLFSTQSLEDYYL